MPYTDGEQERNLWIASRRYVIGEIGIEELEAIELIEFNNFKHAVHTLAKMQSRQWLRHKLLKLWRIGRWKRRD
jgi:hypothetical protein